MRRSPFDAGRPRLAFSQLFAFGRERQGELFTPIRRSGNRLQNLDQAGGLFDGGPPTGLQMRLGLLRMDRPRVLLRALLVAALGWFPLFVLTALESALSGDGSFRSFITDYGALGRSLVAAPVLVIAEATTAPRLSAIAAHFASLVPPKDLTAFRESVLSTYRLRDSAALEIAVLLAAFIASAVFALSIPAHNLPLWHSTGHARSAAGWWGALISSPLLVLLLLGWLWRLVLWTRFLWRMAQLDLRLVAAHPDRAAGLKFVDLSLQAFSVVAFALGAAVAGMIANRVIHDHIGIASFQIVVPSFAAIVVALLSSPLLVFAFRLLETQRQSIFEYGALAHSLGRQMEKRWLNQATDSSALAASDFSATTDLYSVVSNVYAMNVVPVSLRSLAVVAVATLLPMVPVVLVSVSPEVIIEKLTGRLF